MEADINSLKPSGHYMYPEFNIQQFYVLPTQCIYVFWVDLRTNRDYFPIQHWLSGLYNWEGVGLLRGTDWIFKCYSEQFQSSPAVHINQNLTKDANVLEKTIKQVEVNNEWIRRMSGSEQKIIGIAGNAGLKGGKEKSGVEMWWN